MVLCSQGYYRCIAIICLMLMATIKENYCCLRNYLETSTVAGECWWTAVIDTYRSCHVYVILVIIQERLHGHSCIAVKIVQGCGCCFQEKSSKVEDEHCKMVSKILEKEDRERCLQLKIMRCFFGFLFRMMKLRFRKIRTFVSSLTTSVISFGCFSNAKLLEPK